MRQEQEAASAEITEPVPGVLRLQLPIPFGGLGHVNCYALEDGRGVTLVDPGLPGPTAWRALRRRLRAAGIPLRRVTRSVVTHSHPDHFGGAPLLGHAVGADVLASTHFSTWWDPDDDDLPADADDEAPTRPARRGSPVTPFGRPTPWGGRTHVPPLRTRVQLGMLTSLGRRWFRTPRPTTRADDGDRLRLAGRDWELLHTPGHTHDHLCLWDPETGTLLSGDHVLPTITPHLSGVGGGTDPLAAYVRSLERVAALDDVRTVLPAHGHPFDDLAGRTAAIVDHHDERLEELRAILDETGPATVGELSRRLFRRSAWGSLAESETFAHLEHLRLDGSAGREEVGGELVYGPA